jgi:YjbE family integral membrane protein
MSGQHRCRYHLGLDDAGVRAYVASVLVYLNQASALLSVVIIDIVLAGDNAIVVGMAAAGLPAARRRRVIAAGIAAATVLRILFAVLTMQLLGIIGLIFAGGVLLLWVAWKMYRELRAAQRVVAPAPADGQPDGQPPPPRRPPKTTAQAMCQIVLADLSMSLDNVLAVAGVARTQSEPWVLVVGLVLSVALMGIASNYIARLLDRMFWISWVGLGIVAFVALRMIWDGSAEILHHSAALGLGAS